MTQRCGMRNTTLRRRSALAVLVSALVVLAAVGQVEAAAPQAGQQHHQLSARRPAKRSYDTHAYYVLEVASNTPHAEVLAVASRLGAELVEQVGELRDHYLLRAPFSGRISKREPASTGLVERDAVLEAYHNLYRPYGLGYVDSRSQGHPALLSRLRQRTSIEHSPSLSERSSNVLSLERQIIKQRTKRELKPEHLLRPRQQESDTSKVSQYVKNVVERFGMFDPEFPGQWHLLNDVIHENSINVTGVWDQGITGQGIRVAIVDDGLDMHSDDLKDNFYAEGSWDYNDHTDLPEPRLSDDQHGTRCAGEIAAVKNDVCGVGVAYGAKISGIRILSASISDADEASALNFGYQTNDIYSCSWGPPDDGRSMEAPSPLIYKSMLNGVQNGRGGKGSIFVFASGNGGAVDDQCNFDGYTNSIFSITISAIDRLGLHPYYSEGCSANMVVTYSSGSGDNIHTTDVGERKCTAHHGGTSAAAPIAAGIYALALQARPELTWRDLQHITVQTAIQVNPNDPDWQTTHAGRPYNHKYGYGKLDAYRIVELARTFKQVKPQAWYNSPVSTVNEPITKEGVSSTINIANHDLRTANFEKLEHVTITVNAEHGKRGDMEVVLESPNGVKSILARPRRFDDDQLGFPAWTFMSVKHWDESPLGAWKLTMMDRQNDAFNGTFLDWKMTLWGSSIDAAIAKPFKMQDDSQIILPQPPHHKVPLNLTTSTITYVSDGETLIATTTITAPHDLSTKSYLKPTAHLPDDHGQATGESDHPLDGLPTSTSTTEGTTSSISRTSTATSSSAAATSTIDAVTSEEDTDTSYLGPFYRLADHDDWVYYSLGLVVILLVGGGAYVWYRRRQRRGFQLLGANGEATLGDYESVPMTALERGRRLFGLGSASARLRPQQPRGTKALYDAFALSDSDEEEDNGTGGLADRDRLAETGGASSRLLPPSGAADRVDDSYMSDFLHDDDEDGDSSIPRQGSAGPRQSTPALELHSSTQQRYRDDDDVV